MKKTKLFYLGNKLSKHGNTTTVIETLGLALEQEGFIVYYASDKKNQLLRLIDMVAKTLYYVTKVDYVLIDTYSTFSFYYTLATSQICRLFRKKYIPILHGGNLPNRLENSKILSKMVFKNAYVNVAPSNYLFDAFAVKGFFNLVFIPNSINISEYDFIETDVVKPNILWVRSFSKIYNPKMAIEVLTILKTNYQDATLCMVGPDKENLLPLCKEYAAQKNVEVTFAGKLTKPDWIALSRNYSVFINTTHFDNTPVSVIEAMALGLPVVSTNVGGIPFLVSHNKEALLVNDNDAVAMSNAIKQLLEDATLRNNLVINARKKAESFNWDFVKEKWFEILK